MTVNIGGKDRPVKFTNNALIELLEEHGIDFLKNPELVNPKNIRAICFVGLKHGTKAEKKDLDFTIEDMGDWLDMSDMGPNGNVTKIFAALRLNTETDQKGEAKGE